MKLLLLSLVLVSSGDVIPTDDSRTTSNHVFSFVRRSVFGKRRTQSYKDLRAIFVFCVEENSELRAARVGHRGTSMRSGSCVKSRKVMA